MTLDLPKNFRIIFDCGLKKDDRLRTEGIGLIDEATLETTRCSQANKSLDENCGDCRTDLGMGSKHNKFDS